MPSSGSISIVAIGRNEGPRLEACFRSLAGLDLKEVIYVDSGSTDNSLTVAESCGASVVKLDMTIAFTAARARNAGFAKAMSSPDAPAMVHFIDADCSLAAGWLELAKAFLDAHPQVTAVCGRRRERFPERSIYNRLCDREWNTPAGEAAAFGGDVLIRTEALAAVGGYNDALICGEEPELCIRLRERGGRIWRLDAEMTLHDANMQHFSQWWRRSVRGGYGFAKVALMHHRSPYGIWKREVLRAILYGFVIPVLALLGSLVHPLVLALLLFYPLQVMRIALRSGSDDRDRWLHAFFLVIGKFAEFQGLCKFAFDLLLGRRSKLIEYKKAAEAP